MRSNRFMPLKLRNIFLLFSLMSCGATAQIFAHGGEDHGEAKPTTAKTTAGAVTRSARLNDFEITFKHPSLEPDTAATGRLFITKFATNEAFGDANPAIEIESATGTLTQISVEKSDMVGNYVVRIPALPEGIYTARARVTTTGKTDTATFSGFEIARQEPAATETGSNSGTQTALLVLLTLLAFGLFGGLAYFTQRIFRDNHPGKEIVST